MRLSQPALLQEIKWEDKDISTILSSKENFAGVAKKCQGILAWCRCIWKVVEIQLPFHRMHWEVENAELAVEEVAGEAYIRLVHNTLI